MFDPRVFLLGGLVGVAITCFAFLLLQGLMSRQSSDPKYFMRVRRYQLTHPRLVKALQAFDPDIMEARVDSNRFKRALQRVRAAEGMRPIGPDVPIYVSMRVTEDRLAEPRGRVIAGQLSRNSS